MTRPAFWLATLLTDSTTASYTKTHFDQISSSKYVYSTLQDKEFIICLPGSDIFRIMDILIEKSNKKMSKTVTGRNISNCIFVYLLLLPLLARIVRRRSFHLIIRDSNMSGHSIFTEQFKIKRTTFYHSTLHSTFKLTYCRNSILIKM